MTDNQRVEHWPGLDGLRGLAVAGVVAFHLDWLSGGFLGVDLFFVISGFVITTLLVRQFSNSGASGPASDGSGSRVRLSALVVFWGQRFRRLLPAVMVLIAVTLAWLAWWGTASEQAVARDDARWAIAYLANWHSIDIARDYWAATASASVFNHLWSLAIEEQFYVIWPLVVWWSLRCRRGAAVLTAATAVLAAASIVSVIVLGDDGPSRLYFGTDTRSLALLLGSALAVPVTRRWLARLTGGGRGLLRGAAGAAAAVLLVWWCVGGHTIGFLLHGGMALHSLLATTVIAGVITAPGRAERWVAHPLLRWLGTRSYGIYLWHWPIIVLGRSRLTSLPSVVVDLGFIVATVALAEASYRALEQPIRRRTSWAVGRRATWATVALTSLAITIAVIAPSGRGQIAAFDAASLIPTSAASPVTATTLAATPSSSPAPTGSSAITPVVTNPVTPTTAAPATSTTTTTTLDITPRPVRTVVWFGDSIASDLAPALGAALDAAGVEMFDGAIAGARFTPSDTVDPVSLYGGMIDAHPADLVVAQLSIWDTEAPIDVLREHLGWLHDRVRASGADLLVVTPPPIRSDLVDPRFANQITIIDELIAADPQHVDLIDSFDLWGPTMVIDIGDDGIPDRKPDGVHICPQGAARFAGWVVDRIDERYDAITPVFPTEWMGGRWTRDRHYDTPVGACALLR